VAESLHVGIVDAIRAGNPAAAGREAGVATSSGTRGSRAANRSTSLDELDRRRARPSGDGALDFPDRYTGALIAPLLLRLAAAQIVARPLIPSIQRALHTSHAIAGLLARSGALHGPVLRHSRLPGSAGRHSIVR